MKTYVIIVAAGSGTRMQSEIPKQFIEIHHKPLFHYTIDKFIGLLENPEFIVVLSAEYLHKETSIKKAYPDQEISVVEGGNTRFHSVQNAVRSIKETEGIVLIHDSVRPFVSRETILGCVRTTVQKGNAIPVIELQDSLRYIEKGENKQVERSHFRAVQTPQCFELGQLQHAFQCTYSEHFTDDASVFENAGHTIELIEGNAENIKITLPFHLKLAEKLLK